MEFALAAIGSGLIVLACLAVIILVCLHIRKRTMTRYVAKQHAEFAGILAKHEAAQAAEKAQRSERGA